MNSSHFYGSGLGESMIYFIMLIKKEQNRIPQGNIERLIPSHVLKGTVFSGMGIRVGGLSSTQKGFTISRPRKRGYHILIMTISGKGKFLMEDNSTVLSEPGDIFFSHADGQGHIHQPQTGPWKFFWLQFNTSQNWLIPPFQDWGLIRSHDPNNAQKLGGILESIFNNEMYINAEENRLQRLYAELFMLQLQKELQLQNNDRMNRYRSRLNQLWQTVTASPNKTWTLKTMSRFAGLSRAQLSRVCVLLYRKTPGEKVKEIRMEYVFSLLKYFGYQVSEAAERVGYRNMSNFSAAFKKYFGYSPRNAVNKIRSVLWCKTKRVLRQAIISY
jgi:AraC-like DNA-binding protein